MWWFPGLLGMLLGFAVTIVMLAVSLTTRTPYQQVFVKLFAVMLCCEAALLAIAITFIVLAEMGRI